MLKKDKEKVFGGEWTQEQLEEFLCENDYEGETAAYTSIIRAYRHMMPATFADFLIVMKEKGLDISAQNDAGESALAVISTHAQGADFAQALKDAGAE